MATDADLETLIQGYLTGAPDALRTVDGWIERAAAPFRSRLGVHWDDVLQMSRMEAAKLLRAGAFRGESALSTYLWRVVSNICLRLLARQERMRTVDLEDNADALATDDPSPLDRLVREEDARLALRVMAAMPADCRRIWTMVAAGRTYAEIATELDSSEGALRVKALRCRRRALAKRDELTSAKVVSIGVTRSPGGDPTS